MSNSELRRIYGRREPTTCKNCCSGICGAGSTALFLWLLLAYSSPKCFIRTLYLPSLNTTLNFTSPDPTINLTLRLVNPNKVTGIKYYPINVTLYDFPNKSHVLGSISVPRFRQGPKKKATKSGEGNANTTMVLEAVSKNGTGVFWVELTTRVRFMLLSFIQTKEKFDIVVGANIVVNASGVKVDHEDTRLEDVKSMAPKMESVCVLVVGTLMNFLTFTLFMFL